MAYLSKKAILYAYSELSKLTSDPSAQGATQITSALRYIFALDEFTKAFNKNCDTSNKEDRDKFISFVGNVVSINKDYYTANFFNAIKDNPDYAVGSNFFSVNVVKNSLVNLNTDFPFPKRGNNPLFIVKSGCLIEKTNLLPNLKEFLHTPLLRNAFAVWLMRFEPFNSDDVFGTLVSGLRKRYSQALINELQLDKMLINQFIGDSLIDNPYLLSISDFPSVSAKEKEANFQLLPTEELVDKVRDSFLKYWEIIDQHGTQSMMYVYKYESELNPILERLDIGITNIFEIVNFENFKSVISLLIKKEPSLSYLNDEKGPTGSQYNVWSTNKHFSNFLKILSVSDFFANMHEQKNQSVQLATKATLQNKNYLRAMRTKPFLLLAGISGTGKSRIVKQMAFDSCPDGALRKDPTSPGNYCLIEVKPNWHDSTELLGYESQINGAHYQLTPFIKFVAKAMIYANAYPQVPFFVCLDEMNLAPVEQYFAEFLSVLESRTKINGHIVSEPLIPASIFANKEYKSKLKDDLFTLKLDSHTDENTKAQLIDGKLTPEEEAVYDELEKFGLRIPENLIVIGTVNMDETTHQFSRKVIDRAMTIEMNLPEGMDADGNTIDPFMDFFKDGSDLAYRNTPESASLFLSTQVKAADVVSELISDNTEKTERLKTDVAKFLNALNTALEGTPFKIAYRVQNELMLYFYQLWLEDKSADWETIFATTADQILMMKVLPRIEGDEELLENPLKRLTEFCAPYPNASKKLAEMTSRLEKSRFASFWP